MKKTITVFLIIVLLLNLICPTSSAQDIQDIYDDMEIFDPNDPTHIIDNLNQGEGEVENDSGDKKTISTQGTTHSAVQTFSTLVHAITVIPQVLNEILVLGVQVTGGEKVDRFTIYDTVMGEYEIFNINYHNVPDEPTEDSSGYDVIRYNVVKYYNIFRNLSLAISLFVLIYIGIRMAISTVASDKAKYSKMLINWIASVFLLIFMHLIIIIISFLLQKVLDIINSLATTIGVTNIEKNIYNGLFADFSGGLGWALFTAFLSICLLIYYEIKFFIMYIHRVIEIAFLVVIAPLITITYSIDKAGDNKAQAFKAWLTEFTMKASLQVIHAVLFCVFIASAGVIAQNHPLLAIIFLGLLSRSEKIVRNMFSVKGNGLDKTKIPFIGK